MQPAKKVYASPTNVSETPLSVCKYNPQAQWLRISCIVTLKYKLESGTIFQSIP